MPGINARRMLKRTRAALATNQSAIDQVRAALIDMGYSIVNVEEIPNIVRELGGAYLELRAETERNPPPARPQVSFRDVAALPAPEPALDLTLPDFSALSSPATAPPSRMTSGIPARPGIGQKPEVLDPKVIADRLSARIERANTEGVRHGIGGGGLPGQNGSAPRAASRVPVEDQRGILSQALGRPVEPPTPGMPNRLKS